jgi:hypothetical protein
LPSSSFSGALRLLANTIRAPSGDQLGAPSWPGERSSTRRPVPSVAATASSVLGKHSSEP